MAGPWEQFSPAPTGPWTQFAPQAPTPNSNEQTDPGALVVDMGASRKPQGSQVASDTASDIAKSAGIGVAKGAIGLTTAPQDISDFAGNGFEWGIRKVLDALGVQSPSGKPFSQDFSKISQENRQLSDGSRILPRADEVQSAIEQATGPFYQPKTTAGKYAETIGEFVPAAATFGGAAPSRIVQNAVIPGAASEAAGQATAGTPYETIARVAGAVAAPAAIAAGRRAITPLPITPERQALVDTMTHEGVPLTAGQATGSKPLRWMESALGDMPGAGGVAHTADEAQRTAFTRAALRRIGVTADYATPDVLQAARDRISNQFNTLAARNSMNFDAGFAQDVTRTLQEYGRVLPSEQRQRIFNILQDLTQQAGGPLPGNVYQTTRSRLTKAVQSYRQSDPQFALALRGIRDAMDNAMGRSVSPGDRAAWQEARRKYGNLRQIEQAAGAGGENAAQGNISPAQLRMAASSGNRSGYARGQGDFAELARAGSATMSPLPQSGTGPRQHVQHLAHLAGGIGGALGGGVEGAALGLLASTMGPAALGRALYSRSGQAYLSNQLIRNGMGNVTIPTLINAYEQTRHQIEPQERRALPRR